MMFTLVEACTCSMSAMSRPRFAGVTSTMVPTPRSSSCAKRSLEASTQAADSSSSGQWAKTSVPRIATCSCMKVRPSSEVSTGPRAVCTVGMFEAPFAAERALRPAA